jgi:hypothetical protein
MDMTVDKQLSDYGEDGLMPARVMPSLFEGTTVQTWAALRHKGNGPPFVKVMRRVYYRRCDVEAWIEQNRKVRTDRPVISTPRRTDARKKQGRPLPEESAVQHPLTRIPLPPERKSDV